MQYSSLGLLQWSQVVGTVGTDQGLDVIVSADGQSIYVTGYVFQALNNQAYAGEYVHFK